jgi:Bardet-Biedl syndrome 1 protein
MHNAFQRDLVKLRLNAARVYTKMILGGHGPIANTGDTIKLDGHTQGLGPLFKIVLDVRNVGEVPVPNIAIAVTFDHNLYTMDAPVLVCPLLVPSVSYTYEFQITCIDENGANAPARVWVCNNNSCVPSLCALINIPPSQLLE